VDGLRVNEKIILYETFITEGGVYVQDLFGSG
jgi:hypothetical protein